MQATYAPDLAAPHPVRDFGRIVGRSSAMLEVYELIERVGPTDAPVLITGESGTGKELVAEAIHGASARRRAVFLPVNCSAVSASLFESELFGHERGSFTGADRRRIGHFERASGGTLLLDEVTEMPLDLQAKLLRVIETGALLRVGSSDPVQLDVRIVATTNREPGQAVKEGRLREDLFYRLSVFPIDVPALRCRGDDIALLARHFLSELSRRAGSSKRWREGAIKRLQEGSWPGTCESSRARCSEPSSFAAPTPTSTPSPSRSPRRATAGTLRPRGRRSAAPSPWRSRS
jgi:two-component system, NtrC family, response regulator AtoC